MNTTQPDSQPLWATRIKPLLAPTSASRPTNSRAVGRRLSQWSLVVGALLVAGFTVFMIAPRLFNAQPAAEGEATASHPAATSTDNTELINPPAAATVGVTLPEGQTPASEQLVEYPESQWTSAGIAFQPVQRAPFATSVPLTGKVALNQDRIAHVYSMVEGAVESVSVSLGQNVQENDELAVIHSREIGEAKLRLYQAQLKLDLALTRKNMQEAIVANAGELVAALRRQIPIEEIEPSFRGRPMGDYRERLLATYANYTKSAADVRRLQNVVERGAVAGTQLLTAEANRNADQATFQARLEQIEYELQLSKIVLAQAVKEAETEVAVAQTSLMILGCPASELVNIDPATQGQAISHYRIRAPFNGTVLTKDMVLREQVRTDGMLLSIADLSTVWITANVYAEHVRLLGDMKGRTLTFKNDAWPEQTFEAEIFYTGDVMDESTRTISLRAVANNAERRLKPGMFVSVSLPGIADSQALQVPVGAIQEHAGEKFVFVHRGGAKFERRNVQVGAANEKSAMIIDGLKVGESVVVQGGFILKSRLLAELLGEE